MKDGEFHCGNGFQHAGPAQDSIVAAVYIAALISKGYYESKANAREMQARLIHELRQLGAPPDPDGAATGACCAFSIQGLVRVVVMEYGQDKTACLEALRADLLAHKTPLGLLIDFKSSLVVDGITRVNPWDAIEKRTTNKGAHA